MWIRSRRKLHLVVVLVAAILVQLMLITAQASSEPIIFSHSGVMDAPRTVCDLHRQWDAIPIPAKRFDTLPSVRAPFSAGKLSDDAIAQGLSYINFTRYAAGLPAVTTSAEDNLSAQYGAVLLAAIGKLTHTPYCPANMSGSFFQNGCQALFQSNISKLSFGSSDPANQEKLLHAMSLAIKSYTDEDAYYNRFSVAHRRWLLSPALQVVGIGSADSGIDVYHVLKVIGTNQSTFCAPDYDFISWPASGVFPSQLISMNVPWSIALNTQKFKIPNRSSLAITISRSDGKCWTLNANSSADSRNETFLKVDAQFFGDCSSIIFAFPAGSDDAYSGSYHVTVSGLTTTSGQAAKLDYTTQFSDMSAPNHVWGAWVTRSPVSCTASGLAWRECTQCHTYEEKQLAPLGHDWNPALVLQSSEKYCAGKAVFSCSRCHAQKTDQLPPVLCNPQTCPCTAFRDMPAPNSWSHNGIDFVVENAYFCGTNPIAFSPKGAMTRGMLITVLWRMAGKPAPTAKSSFSDVGPLLYYTDAVAWGCANGIVNGVSPTRFSPSSYVTREQAVTFLYRFFDEDPPPAGDLLSAYADAAQVKSYATDAMVWAIQNNILEGKPNSSGQLVLFPGSNITREQAATVIMRCMLRTP